jgi:hypothetical protein
MDIEQHFIHLCTIRRITATQNDPYGNAQPTWGDLATNVPCRLFEVEEDIAVTERIDSVVTTKYLLLVGADVDIQEQDKIEMLSDAREKNFMVLKVIPRQLESIVHHKSVNLLTVNE